MVKFLICNRDWEFGRCFSETQGLYDDIISVPNAHEIMGVWHILTHPDRIMEYQKAKWVVISNDDTIIDWKAIRIAVNNFKVSHKNIELKLIVISNDDSMFLGASSNIATIWSTSILERVDYALKIGELKSDFSLDSAAVVDMTSLVELVNTVLDYPDGILHFKSGALGPFRSQDALCMETVELDDFYADIAPYYATESKVGSTDSFIDKDHLYALSLFERYSNLPVRDPTLFKMLILPYGVKLGFHGTFLIHSSVDSIARRKSIRELFN